MLVKAKLMNPSALGRVWTEDHRLREALERDPEIAFVYFPANAGWPAEWSISVRYHEGERDLIALVEGRAVGLRFGAELFRRLTGKEVDVSALLRG